MTEAVFRQHTLSSADNEFFSITFYFQSLFVNIFLNYESHYAEKQTNRKVTGSLTVEVLFFFSVSFCVGPVYSLLVNHSFLN